MHGANEDTRDRWYQQARSRGLGHPGTPDQADGSHLRPRLTVVVDTGSNRILGCRFDLHEPSVDVKTGLLAESIVARHAEPPASRIVDNLAVTSDAKES